jgi:TorA maturation chaperone TorD
MGEWGPGEEIRGTGSVNALARPFAFAPAPVLPHAGHDARELFGSSDNLSANLDEIDAARAREYALLALLLSEAPTVDLLSRLGNLQVDPSALGLAHAALAAAARETDAERAGREYFDLFIGLGRGELLPYGSYYLTGFLHERPLARLRGDLAAIGIARAEDNPEPEDHAAILCEIMSGVIGAEFAAPAGTDRQIFEKHMAPWIGRFFADLERAEMARFYRSVGTLGRTFIDIETQAFALPS